MLILRQCGTSSALYTLYTFLYKFFFTVHGLLEKCFMFTFLWFDRFTSSVDQSFFGWIKNRCWQCASCQMFLVKWCHHVLSCRCPVCCHWSVLWHESSLYGSGVALCCQVESQWWRKPGVFKLWWQVYRWTHVLVGKFCKEDWNTNIFLRAKQTYENQFKHAKI